MSLLVSASFLSFVLRALRGEKNSVSITVRPLPRGEGCGYGTRTNLAASAQAGPFAPLTSTYPAVPAANSHVPR